MKTYFKLLLLFVLFFAIGHPRAVAEEITICNGTATNEYVPLPGENISSSSSQITSQMIYPASSFSDAGLSSGEFIKSITFSTSDNSYIGANTSGRTIIVKVGEVSNATVTANSLANRSLIPDAPIVFNATPAISSDGHNMTFTFSGDGYKWNGGDVVIEMYIAAGAGSGSRIDWVGVEAKSGASGSRTYNARSNKWNSAQIQSFLPKMMIVCEGDIEKPSASVSPESLAFTDVQAGYSATQSITITNTSNNGLSLVPSLAITGTDAGLFSVGTSELRTLDPGKPLVVPVTYSPTTAGQTHSAILTLTYVTPGENPVSGQPIEVSLTGNSVTPQYALTATPAEGTVNFGTVIVGGNPARFVTKKVSITNVGISQWSIPTSNIVTTGDAAFDITSNLTPNQNTIVVEPGEELSFTITFTPTEDKNYEGTLSITPFDRRTVTWFLMGEGSNAEPTQFDNLTYKWPFNAVESEQTTSYMSEIATDPDQMIALCRAVYMNTDIPGNYTRGYTSDGKRDDSQNVRNIKGAVSYPAIGKIHYSSSGIYTDDPYSNSYGWDIPTTKPLITEGVHTYFDPTEYKPKEEGVTLLMVEMKDGALPSSYTTAPSSYATLRALFAAMFKSIRVVKDFKKVGTAGSTDEGTLFKIDADKLNRFFFLAKGRLRHGEELFGSEVYGTCIEPNYRGSSYSYSDSHGQKPFYNMFEELSPVSLDGSSSVTDAYQSLVNMQSYTIEHDCNTVPYMTSSSVDGVTPGHEFNMYGPTSASDDCQDVRDLMFLVPERRMTWWDSRDGNSTEISGDAYVYTGDMYKNYYKPYAPTLGLFAIVQEPIVGQKKDNEDVYQLTLTWHSNLLNFLPDGGKYQIYQVVNNNGVETYVPIGDVITATKKSDENETYQYVEIPMLEHGQQVTFVIQAMDNDRWLTMQMSNKQSYIIPGTNPAEMLQLVITETNSRFDPQRENNYYSNGLQLKAYENQFKSEYITTGTEFTLWRTARTPQRDEQGNIKVDEGGNIVYDEVETQIGTATVAANNNITITIDGDQTLESEFPTGKSNETRIAAGYKTNFGNATYTVNNDGYVQLNNVTFYDNFQASTASNNHPTEYVYKVKLTTAVPLNGLPNCVTWQEGKTFAYFERPSEWDSNYNTIRAWAWIHDDATNTDTNLTGDEWPGNGNMTWVGQASNGNGVYLWSVDETVQPTHILFNGGYDLTGDSQTGNFTFTNGGYYRTSGLVGTITEDNTSNEAESNTAHVFIPKTKMEMAGVMSLAQVNADGVEGYKKAAQLPDGKEFTVDVKYASRAEVLRYDVYRWNMNETDHRYIIDEVKTDGSEEDIAPNGEADNGEGNGLYTLKMNGNTLPSVTVAQGETAAASFVDDFVRNNAGDWVYAPVVETFGTNGNYNTYGAPLKSTVSGTVEIEVEEVDMVQSKYTWQEGSDTYTYYYVPVTIKKVEVPEGYNVYKVRGWRLVDESFLGEELQGQTLENGTQLPDRSDRLKDDYLFEDLNFGDDKDGMGVNGMSKTSLVDYPLGSRPRPDGQIKDGKPIEMMATFGGKKLSDGETIDAKFYVRIYFTPEVNPAVVETAPSQGAPRRAETALTPADFDYYVAEGECEVELTSGIITGVNNVNVSRDIQSVTYVNPMGQVSSRPFSGVNIIVTRYSDGTSTTRKVIR